MSTTRVLHWNVYEDGLADTPGALGFSDAFESRSHHSWRHWEAIPSSASTRRRDFAQLPEVTPVADNVLLWPAGLRVQRALPYHRRRRVA